MSKFIRVSAYITLLLSLSVSAQVQIETDQIEDNAVTNQKLEDVNGWTLKGRNSPVSGNVQDVSADDIVEDLTIDPGDYAVGFDSSDQLRKFDLSNIGGGATQTITRTGDDITLSDGGGTVSLDSVPDGLESIDNASGVTVRLTKGGGLFPGLSAQIQNATTTSPGVLSAADKTKLDNVVTGPHTVNTNAATICAGATEVLQGDGTCVVPSSSGGNIYDTDGVIGDQFQPRTATLNDFSIFSINGSQGQLFFKFEDQSAIEIGGDGGTNKVSVSNSGIDLDFSATDDLEIEGTAGTAGQVLKSSGDNLPPSWSSITESDIVDLTHTVDTNTNAATECAGINQLYYGDGRCDGLSMSFVGVFGNTELRALSNETGLQVEVPRATTTSDGFLSAPDKVKLDGLATGSHTIDTNAQTICSGLESLRGDGSCAIPSSGGSESTTVSDTATVNLTLVGSDIQAAVIESALTITESQISDLSHTVDTDTQLSEAQVDTFVANNGFISDYTVTQADVLAHEGAITINESQISDLAHTVDTNTNAQTICAGAGEVLFGDGSCAVPSGSDGNGIYSGAGSLVGATNVEVGVNRLRFRDASSQTMFQIHGGNEIAQLGISGEAQVGALIDGVSLNFGAADDLNIDGLSGTSGQVLTSNGDSLPPTWSAVSGDGNGIYSGGGSLSGITEALTGGFRFDIKETSATGSFLSINPNIDRSTVGNDVGVTVGAIQSNAVIFIPPTGGLAVGSSSSDVGTDGQVLTSSGVNVAPAWKDIEAINTATNTTAFDGNLSASDLTVQDALNTLDDLTVGGGSDGNGIYDADGTITSDRLVQTGTNSFQIIGLNGSGSSASLELIQSSGRAILSANEAGLGGASSITVDDGSGITAFTNVDWNFSGDAPIQMQGNAGTTGQVLTSTGATTGPTWSSLPAASTVQVNSGGALSSFDLSDSSDVQFTEVAGVVTATVSATAPLSDEQSSQVSAAASGSTLGLEQGLLAAAGQPALTVLAVAYTNTGKVQGVSLGDGNVIEVYADGAAFSAGTVLYREFMSLAEPIVFTGLSSGSIITSTQGFYGFSEQLDGADESPLPLLSYGLSFKQTFMFAFRNSQTYDPAGTSANQGWIHLVNGPLGSTCKLTNGSGVTVQGQEDIALDAWQYQRFYTSGNEEYIIDCTNPVMAAHSANMDSSPEGRFYDSRLIMPLTNDGITWPRSGFVSAPYDNTVVNWFTADNTEGSLNSGLGVSPGTPIDFDAAAPLGTGASDQDYEPAGATRVLAVGLISAYSGADSAGLEASPLMPTSAMSQVVAQPLFIADTGDGGDSGVAIASPYQGTAKVYEWNDTTKTIDLAYTVPLNRQGVTVTDKEDQKHPASGLVSNDTNTGVVTLVGQLNPGVIIADVPITVVVQNGDPALIPTIRSQNGTTATSIVSQDDETLSLGWTPSTLKAEITEGADNKLYRRVLDAGVESWVDG